MDVTDRDLPAQTTGRLAAAGSVLFAAGSIHVLLDLADVSHPWLAPLVAAFVAGVAISFAPGTEGWFRRASGLALGWGSFLVLTAASLVAGIGAGESLDIPQVVGLIPLVLVGADWHRVGRLQTSVLLPGIGVVVALTRAVGDDGVTLTRSAAPVLVWLATAMGAFAVLQRDRATALTRPTPTAGRRPGPARVPVVQVIGVGAGALVLALALALTVESPSLSPFDDQDGEAAPQEPGAAGADAGGSAAGGSPAAGGSGASGGAATQGDPGAGGNVYVDGGGGVYVYDRETGDYVSVPEEAQVDSRGQLWPPRANPRTLPGGSEVVGGDVRDGNLVTPDGRPLVPTRPERRGLGG